MKSMTNHSDEDKNKSRSWLERLSALLGREPQDASELIDILRDAEDREILSTDMLAMIERIVQVSEMQVREVMVPKAQMVVINKEDTLENILPIIIESAHSRFPVYEANGEDIAGMLLAKDLLQYGFNAAGKPFNLNDVLRPALFTPQSKRLDILLREFRIKRNHIAIVLDEYGHVAGLITIEDILEQIVGDIEDEYDIDEKDGNIKKLGDGTYIIKATTPIEEFNDYFKSTFSDEDYDTMSGIVLQAFGHLPKRGETIKLQNFRFKVLHSDNRRVYLLEAKPIKRKSAK